MVFRGFSYTVHLRQKINDQITRIRWYCCERKSVTTDQSMQLSNQPVEMISTLNKASWTAQSIVTTNRIDLPTQQEQINPTMTVTDASCIAHSVLITEQAPLPSQPEEIEMPGVVNAWVAQAILAPIEIPLSTQSEEINLTTPLAENIWTAQTTFSQDQDPLSIQSDKINQPVLDAENSLISNLIINTNQAPTLNQLEEMNQIIPMAESSWVNYRIVNFDDMQSPVQVTNVPWGIVAIVYPNETPLDQTKERDSIEPCSSEPVVVSSDATWEVHPYIRASLDSLTEPQASDQQPVECNSNCQNVHRTVSEPTIHLGTQSEYEQDMSTIAVPLLTDPNVTPELITFRPGIYEGDAIPPVYSDFSIIAASNDYEPTVPSPVYPNLSIIPEKISEDIPHEPTTNQIPMVCAQPIVAKDVQENALIRNENMVGQKLPKTISELSTKTSYRGIDAKLLTSLRHIKLIMIYKGYHFSRYYCQGSKIRWHCINRRCAAYLYSVQNKITVTYPVHNHLSVISQNSTSAQTTKSHVVLPFVEELTENILPFNDGSDPKTLKAAATDIMTLCNDNNVPQNTEVTFHSPQSLSFSSDNKLNSFSSIDANFVAATNTIIPHEPKLAITVKSKSEPTVSKVKNDMMHVDNNTQLTESNAVFTCKEARNSITEYISSFNYGNETDLNILRVANNDTLPLLNDNMVTNIVAAANTIIHHDPSLEITVKPKSVLTETVNNDITNADTSSQSTESNSVFTLEEARSAITEYLTSFDDENGIELNTNATHVVETANSIIPHDPNLEITVKSISATTEALDNGSDTCIPTAFSGPDPLAVCVTTYTPPTQNDCDFMNDDRLGTGTNFNYMSVPKNVKAKVTIKTIPRVSKPRFFYDGKPAEPAKENLSFTMNSKNVKSANSIASNAFAVTRAITASNASLTTSRSVITDNLTSTNDQTITSVAPAATYSLTITTASNVNNYNRGISMPIISNPRSQIVMSGSDTRSSHILPYTTPNTLELRSFRQNSDNTSVSVNLGVPNPTQPGNQPQRRSSRTTRGRHSRFRP